MKKILFPATNRVHLARQGILIGELKKHFDVYAESYQSQHGGILNTVADCANHFRHVIKENKFDLVLVRGDRFEVLPIAMLAAYSNIPVAHIEGGDLSGAIDNKVRYAITSLADIHFSTNKESFARLIKMGTDPDWTFNFGSLDVEYAKSIPVSETRDYVVICFHPMPGENPLLVEEIVRQVWGGKVVVIKSNKDNGKAYGDEEFSPDEYIKLIAEARCLIGNSSSFLKEASIFGTPVVNVGTRQNNRLKGENVIDVSCDDVEIRKALEIQLERFYDPSELYYKPETSKRICEKIKKFLG